jgi:hypothetical protein
VAVVDSRVGSARVERSPKQPVYRHAGGAAGTTAGAPPPVTAEMV